MNFQQTPEEKKYIKEKLDRFEKMVSERMVTETSWQEALEYIVPRKSDVTVTKTEGDKRGNELYDTTAILSNQLLSAALHSMLTNPSTRFFELTMGDPELDRTEEIKAWLHEVADRMYVVLNNSNFQTEVHEIYIDEGAIGTACLFMGEHPEKVIHFSARAMKEIYIDENNLGLIDIVARKFSWTPRQIVQEFGEEKVPKPVLEAYQKNVNDKWQILHIVEPKDADDKGEYARYKFHSCYILKDHGALLSRSGYHEFPYAVPRWTKTSGEKYGRGPGTDMLPDIKMVNKMMEATIQGAQLTIRPPMLVADDGVIGKVRMTPAGLTIVRPFADQPVRPLITDARIDFGMQMVEMVRNRIRAGFYVDQLQLQQGPQMTAAEVYQRTEEKLRLMGPVLGRQHFEFLRPLIERLFGVMARRGMIPPAPKAIQGKSLDVRYSSLVARAQRMSEGQNITRAMSVAGPILQVKPESLDLLNGDEAFKYIMDIYGVPQRVMNGQREVQKSREARAQAMEKVAQEKQNAAQADVAAKVLPGVAQLQQAQQQ